MASTMKLLVSLQEGIKRIVINRPERRNALDPEAAQWLREAIATALIEGDSARARTARAGP